MLRLRLWSLSGTCEIAGCSFLFLLNVEHILMFCLYFRWIVDMEGAPGTLYEGEKFQLLFKFSSRYPFDSPQVSRSSSLPSCTCLFEAP